MIITTHSPEETVRLGERIGRLLKAHDVVALSGDLAAGKTTLTKGIAQALGVKDTVTSPTFCIISEYQGTFLTLYHIDAYRLNGPEDFEDLGAEDILSGRGVSVIEWSEKIKEALPKRTIYIKLEVEESGERNISIENLSPQASDVLKGDFKN